MSTGRSGAPSRGRRPSFWAPGRSPCSTRRWRRKRTRWLGARSSDSWAGLVMLFSDPTQQLTDEEFRLIRDLIYSHCGLYFDTDSKYLLDRRLSQRVALHGLAGFREYYQFLKYDRRKDEEISDIMDILTTNETYFFREAFQLKAYTEEILPELMQLKAREKTLRIWS